MAVKKWEGDEARRLIRAGVVRNLHAAAILIKGHAKRLLSVAGTAPGPEGGARIYGAHPSAPGEPPRKQTGRLRASVAHEVDPTSLTARVGTNLKYGRWLELGTNRLAARPWLRRALNETRPAVRRLLARRPPGL
jgi:hypothetical protein